MLNSDKLKIKKATLSDSEQIWKIRNRPEVRKNSHNSTAIPFSKHAAWFRKQYFSNGNNYCFVAKYNDLVIGYCRYDYNSEKEHLLVSIAIDPTMQGKGIGNDLLKNTLSMITSNIKIRAEIHINNLPSLKLFKKNNFSIYKTVDNTHYLRYLRNK